MAEGRRNSRSGGVLLAFSIVAGVVGGMFAGEPSIGFLVGLAVGLLLLALVWMIDRRS
jgi:hypothetical protein